jgi:N-acetylmuramoyl-L-alanine amidase
MKSVFILFLTSISFLAAQVTGLSGWNIFLDPGHSQTANMGVDGYSEAEEVLRTALHLRQILLSQTDIDTVWSSRYNDDVVVSLWERTNDANTRGAAWYHSVHSDAGAATSNKVLLLWGQLSSGAEDPPVGGQAMSAIMVDLLRDVMRIQSSGSWGDCTFYGGCNGGPYLYVNKYTNMPSELSEQGHHTNRLQNQLDMNEEYKRLIAYAMYWTLLEKHNIARPYPGLLSGIIADVETGIRVNGATIQVLDESYTTDTYASLFHQYSNNPDELHNGYYFFEGLPDTTLDAIVSAPGYYADTLQVSMVSDFVTFLDIDLVPNTSPVVLQSEPANGEIGFPAWDVPVVDFSRAMDHASTEAAFSINPDMTGTIYFSGDSKRLAFLADDTLDYETDYTIIIAGTAMDTYGHLLDGNGDGTGGDDWIINFTTSQADLFPPVVDEYYPSYTSGDTEVQPIINILWNEEISTANLNNDLFVLKHAQTNEIYPTTYEHHYVGGKSLIILYPIDALLANANYRVSILPGVMDVVGNTTTQTSSSIFHTANGAYLSETPIERFESGFMNNWWAPQQSGSTTGILSDETSVAANTSIVAQTEGGSSSMQLNYGWNTSSSSWLLREYLSPGTPPRSIHFNSSKVMQAYVFGDGNGNQFRFCVDDNITGAGAHEVSPWYIIDWYGWRLVSWNMATDGTGTWIGDGILNGTMEFDSFQLSYVEGQPNIGSYIIDELRIVDPTLVDTNNENKSLPTTFALLENYPNPFNAMTNIPFILGQDSHVKIKVYNVQGEEVALLFSGMLPQGRHETRWNASYVSSGLYVIQMEAGSTLTTQKITVLK